MPVIHRLPKGDGRRLIGLTIDDGPTASTLGLLRLLAHAGARATFFLSGERMRRRSWVLQKILADGHAAYAHGMEHVQLDRLPPERIVADLATAEALLAEFRPTPDPYLVRLPYASGRRLARVHRAIRAWSPTAQVAHWSVSSEDHTVAAGCADFMDLRARCAVAVARVMARRDLPGAVLLLHDEAFGVDGPYASAATLMVAASLIEALAREGYAFVPLAPIARPTLLSRLLLER